MSEWHIGTAVAGLALIFGLLGCVSPSDPMLAGPPPQVDRPPPAPLLPDYNVNLPGYVPPPGTAVMQP